MASKFLAGALLGLVAGLLLAPEKGETTRQTLADSAEKWKDRLNKMAGRHGLDLEDLKAYMEQGIEGLSTDVKHRILTILDEATDMAYTSKPHVSNGTV